MSVRGTWRHRTTTRATQSVAFRQGRDWTFSVQWLLVARIGWLPAQMKSFGQPHLKPRACQGHPWPQGRIIPSARTPISSIYLVHALQVLRVGHGADWRMSVTGKT